MKRDPRLRPLSRDHQLALALGQRAVVAAEAGHPEGVAETWGEVERRFVTDLAPHFAVEERWLLPPLRTAGEGDMVLRVLEDHRVLRELVEQQGRDGSGQEADPGAAGAAAPDVRDAARRLAEFGTRLRDHVRLEEHEVFPAAERVLDDEALQAVERASEAR